MDIKKDWFQNYGLLLKLIMGMFLAIVLGFTLFKSCTSLGRLSKNSVYVPSSDKGFVMKANALLQSLVDQGNNDHANILPHTMADLQRRYPALRFALPYGEDEEMEGGTRAADIRLVGIIADSIRDDQLRTFFLNSNVPTLLERQQSNLGDRMFNISFGSSGSNTHDIIITRIRVLPGMFRVALDQQPWSGDILCADNALFADSIHCHLVWGQSSVPIRLRPGGQHRRGMLKRVMPNTTTQQLEMNRGEGINYYQLHQAYTQDSTTLCLRLPSGNDCGIYLDYVAADTISLKAVGCYCQPYGASGPLAKAYPRQAHEQGQYYPLGQHLRLVVSGDSMMSNVLCEATVARDNPMLRLSTLKRSSAGRSRYNVPPALTDRFTQQLIHGLSSTLSDEVRKSDVHLSIDPLLSQEMERELRYYTEHTLRSSDTAFHRDDQWEVSLTVMDMATGSIIAAPYYRTSDNRLPYDVAISRKSPALIHRYIGSTFKPLVALAAVLTDTSLIHLNTVGRYHLDRHGDGKKDKGRAIFYDHPTTAWASYGRVVSFWDGCPSMQDFLSRSDDVYPVALTTRALGIHRRTGHPFVYERNQNRELDIFLRENENFTWAHSPFISTFTNLYSIPSLMDYRENDSLQMEYYTWDNMRVDSTSRFGLDNVSPDPTLLYYDVFNSPNALMGKDLAPWVLGQGSNEWNCLKLAEAWSRLLTKRRVLASFVPPSPDAPPFADLAEGYDNHIWNALLEDLRRAQGSGSLLPPMQLAVNHLNRSQGLHGNDSLVLFGKTGTPDNYCREEWKSIRGNPHWLDMGLYCMGIMPSSSYESVKANQGGSGLMCVVSITRITRHKPHSPGIESRDARNFLGSPTDNYRRLRKFYNLCRSYLNSVPPAPANQH